MQILHLVVIAAVSGSVILFIFSNRSRLLKKAKLPQTEIAKKEVEKMQEEDQKIAEQEEMEEKEEKETLPEVRTRTTFEAQVNNAEDYKEEIKAPTSPHELKQSIRRAELLLSHGEDEEAEKILVSVLAQDETNLDAMIFLASLYLKRKQYSRAEVLYRELCELQKYKKAGPLSNLAFCLFEQNKLNEAIQFYQKAMHLEPDNVKRYSNLGQVLFVTKQLPEAIEMFKKASKLAPRDTEILFMLADSLRENRSMKQAYETYNKILNYEPYNAIAREEIGKLESAGFGR